MSGTGTAAAKTVQTETHAERRREILGVAYALLVENGYSGTKMGDIAERCSASNETLYAWFGDKRGLFAEVIRDGGARMRASLDPGSLEGETDASPALKAFGVGFLTLIFSEGSIAVHRIAIAETPVDPTFARTIEDQGRGVVRPQMRKLLLALEAKNLLSFDEADDAIKALIGLLAGDLRVRLLLGVEKPPTPAQIDQRVDWAVERFLKLYGPR